MSDSENGIESKLVLSEKDIDHKIRRLTFEVLEGCATRPKLAFVGVHKRGVTIAERALEFAKKERPDIAFGTLDISLHRDDFDNLATIPTLKGSDIDFDVEGSHVVLFDDVLFTGRTTRAAIDALIDYGRPACIQLAVLVDRGNRELPFAATYVGHKLETTLEDYVRVHLHGSDDDQGVYLIDKKPE